MARVNHLGRAHAQADVRAVLWPQWLHVGPRVEPELGILLAEANGRAAHHEQLITDGAKHCLVKARRTRQITHRDRDVVDHAGAPDFTSLYTIESISAWNDASMIF